MSLITQCPACTTLFKVVPDQLRISEGWVRCGECNEIFDANAQMVREDADAEPVAVAEQHAIAPELIEPAPEALGSDVQASEELETPSDLDALVEVPPVPGPAAETESVMDEWDVDPILAKSPAELSQSVSYAGVDQTTDTLVQVPVEEALDAAVSSEAKVEPRLEQLLADPQISFVPMRAHDAGKDRRSSSALMIFAAGLLTVVLGLQWLVHERDRLAAMEIGLRPVLNVVCTLLDCQVGPLRQIESIAIDSSAFSKVRNDTFRLNFVLKSSASVPLAVPSMELTLTDAQDQALMRKVIHASDFGVQNSSLSPGGDLAVSVPLTAKLPATSERVAGYRLIAFYP